MKDYVVIVSGVVFGLGQVVMCDFVVKGIFVVVVDLNVIDVVDLLEGCVSYVCDVSDVDVVNQVVVKVVEIMGKIGVLVNCVGIVLGLKIVGCKG